MAEGPYRHARLSWPTRLSGGLALAALTACAAGGPAGPDQALGPRAIPVEIATPVPAADLTLETAAGSATPVFAVVPEAPRAVILALHGYGDHGASTFGPAAAAWAEAGIATYAPDQRGFGRGPTRGQWPGAEVLVQDARAYAAAVRARHPGLPLVLLGHSMGGGVALAAAGAGAEVDALVLAAPAIWGGDALNPLQRLAAWTAALVVPDKRFTGEGVVEIRASDNDEGGGPGGKALQRVQRVAAPDRGRREDQG
ncbi:MAG: alpha/beta fold hydrolase, partial [Pseudomonadota bacterium]